MLIGLSGEVDQDSLEFSKVQTISQRLGMFLVTSSEGTLVYQVSVEESGMNSGSVLNSAQSASYSNSLPLDLGDTSVLRSRLE